MPEFTPAVIPARGGSKGVLRKNVKPLQGKPLIVWTIEQALATPGVVPYVSTEDDEIAAVSRVAGARIIERPEELAQDDTASEPVIEHAIDVVTREEGRKPEQVMFLQATSPLRLAGTLERCLTEFAASGADSMVGVVPAEIFLWSGAPAVRAHYPYEARPCVRTSRRSRCGTAKRARSISHGQTSTSATTTVSAAASSCSSWIHWRVSTSMPRRISSSRSSFCVVPPRNAASPSCEGQRRFRVVGRR